MQGKKEKFIKNMKYQPLTIEMGVGNNSVYLDRRQKKPFTEEMGKQLKDRNSHLFALVDAGSVKVIEVFTPEKTSEQPKVLEPANDGDETKVSGDKKKKP